jgi:hypothetical protein
VRRRADPERMESLPDRPEARRALLTRIGVLAVAVALGLVLQRLLGRQLAGIDALSQRDVLAARAELAHLFEIVSLLVFGLTGATGVLTVIACRRCLATGEWPPPGMWSWGSRRVLTGRSALVLARVGVVLGALLVLASLAGGGLMWYMAARLLACRAT